MPSGGKQATLADFGDVFMPTEAAEPILARPVRAALMEWLEEIWAEAELQKVGIGPRKRAMFAGPPGVGKTTLAHHLAARLGLVMVAVRPERLIDSWLGSTGRNIGQLFDLAGAGWPGEEDKPEPIILFLDEFDAVGMKRKQARQGAEDEQNAWVNTLLQRIEQYPSYLIAATNHAEHLDPAIWRRFDIQIKLQLPGQSEREKIIARYLAPFGLPADALRLLGEAMETASPALMRMFCENLKRQLIIGPKLSSDMRKSAVIDRILASVHPHPEVGKPRLWLQLSQDKAIAAMPWPLPQASEIPKTPNTADGDPPSDVSESTSVVSLDARRSRA